MNPVRDLEIISEELRLKDIEFLNGHLEKLEKLVVRGNDKKLKPEYVSIRSNIYIERINRRFVYKKQFVEKLEENGGRN